MASTLYRGGVIHSPADPFAEALLVDDGVIAWIGADDTADGLAARADRVIDLDGALVAPGSSTPTSTCSRSGSPWPASTCPRAPA